jgi:hypothetical protein
VAARHRLIDDARRTQVKDRVINAFKLTGFETQAVMPFGLIV